MTHFLAFLQRARSITITNFLPGIPFLASAPVAGDTADFGTFTRVPSGERRATVSSSGDGLHDCVTKAAPPTAPIATGTAFEKNFRLDCFLLPAFNLRYLEVKRSLGVTIVLKS